ncbi:hypothetical protein E3P99_00396 [Wallemia hederae]|uniref:PITH domain-containing protein n=1 Tax=Wallemia hederae TaxID=1540922 RepID=A0A4T0FVV5_9BASI|nr:hypothetical protein E3P99_00396 [Wallemia hederae]
MGDTSNLYPYIFKSQVTALNIAPNCEAADVIKEYSERNTSTPYIETLVDDQLIVFIPFTTSVKLKSILLGTDNGDLRPSAVKIYTNDAHCPDFDQLESADCLQDMSLQSTQEQHDDVFSGDTLCKEYPLRVARFTNVVSATLFFPSSVGSVQSRLYYVGFKGETLTPHKENDDRMQIAASNVGDTPIQHLKQQAGGNVASTSASNYAA